MSWQDHKTPPGKLWMAGAAACLCSIGCVLLVVDAVRAAEEEPDDPVLQMVIDLVRDSDHDMRALGFQYIREEVPGEAVTKKLAALVPELPPDGQVGLLDALGDRGDTAARPVVLEMLDSAEEAIRAAALRALGRLGGESDVPLLAGKAAAGSDPERAAAQRSLVRLRGDGVDAAIVSAMPQAEPNVRVVLLDVLAGRGASEALPTVLQSAKDADPAVRLAALGALRYLADESRTAEIVDLLKAVDDDQERQKAELALLVVCSRGREACVDDLVAGLAEAEGPSRLVLLHALARAGGDKALQAIVARLEDDDEVLRTEAVRMLSIWGDPAVKSHLLEIAKTGQSPRDVVLAIRGLVRLAGPQEDQPADLRALSQVMDLAKRPQEARLVLGVLGGLGTMESLNLVTPALDDPALAEEAGLAAVMIAERIEDGEKDKIRAAMEKVKQRVKSQEVRDRAAKLLDSL